MNFFKTASARRPEVRRADRTRRHLGLESLETRQVLSTITVNTMADSGPGSLRAAILQADEDNGANTIQFSSALNRATIYPVTALPQLNDQGGLTIDGGSQVTIDLSSSSRPDWGDGSFANGTGNGLVVASRSTATVENLRLVNSPGRGVENDGTVTLLKDYVGYSHNGGVINTTGATMTIQDSVVEHNSARYYGGGVDNSNGTLTVKGTDIDLNTAPEGAGIDVYGGTVSIVSDGTRLSYIELNGTSATSGDGGGIYMSSGSVVSITGGWVAGNMAADGGGIHNEGGVLTATDVSFSGNSAMYGGAIDDYSSSAHPTTLTGCDIEYNSASVAGGGIYVDGTTIQLSASTTLLNNSAPWGSDIYGSYVRKN